MKTHFYLARHGETFWNKTQRFQGQLDSPLTVAGKSQALALADLISTKSINKIISSGLGRARETAKLCQKVLNVPIEHNSELNERHLGVWQGRFKSELEKNEQFFDIFCRFSQQRIPDGESAIGCAERLLTALKSIALTHPHQALLIIGHGESFRCLLAGLGRHFDKSAYSLFKNGTFIGLNYHHMNSHFEFSTAPC
ncbi:histidine phosphatase family protein [Thalassotalea ganghwensis]